LLLAGVRKQQVILMPVDMDMALKNAQQRVVEMIESYKPDLITPSHWPPVIGYAPWIEEIWTNYLSNALKYGGRPPRVEFGADLLDSEQPWVRFWVRDNGPGLTPEQQAALFVPFTRLHKSRAEGHGLGLSIVQRIVEKLGGQVGVESVLGQGSTFYFTLPAHKAG
jgi:signal transduction histidine kinase